MADDLIDVLVEAASAVRAALDRLDDWGLAGGKPGQYRSDLVADEAAVTVLDRAGFGVLSEESALTNPDRPLLAVLDPVDGSTNASRGIPWFATSICVVDAAGPLAALVVNQATGASFRATRGGGAFDDTGAPLQASGAARLADSLVVLSGMPPRPLGWRQFRSFGALALDLCTVAAGMADGLIDCNEDAHGAWDYMAGLLICREAGAAVADAVGRELLVRGHSDRRTPVAAATEELLNQIIAARREALDET